MELFLQPDPGPDTSPLAHRMRPRSLAEFSGQPHLLGPQGFLTQALEAQGEGGEHPSLGNIILWGPPGTGKTTLALLIAQETQRPFIRLSAVLDGLKELRACLQQASQAGKSGPVPILFVDEIHRWNRAQQDALLPWVEQGQVLLIGATTENPAFELNNALLSRVRILELSALNTEDLQHILGAALADTERGLGRFRLQLEPEAEQYLLEHASGDARRLLNAIESLTLQLPKGAGPAILKREDVRTHLQRQSLYDRAGDYHYDTISAFIKSVRGSDVDSALYWLQVMLQGGENPRFIWRRLFILASEDIGLADPQALVQVQAAANAFVWVGLPEGEYFLTQATLYLALAPKGNSVGVFHQAKDLLQRHGRVAIPPYLRSRAKSLAKQESLRSLVQAATEEHAYLYPHSFRGHWVEQNYSREDFLGQIYSPAPATLQGWERERATEHQRRLEILRESRRLQWGNLCHAHYENRHEILLLWEELRRGLAHFGSTRGWDSLEVWDRNSLALAGTGSSFPDSLRQKLWDLWGLFLSEPVLHPSPEFLRGEWERCAPSSRSGEMGQAALLLHQILPRTGKAGPLSSIDFEELFGAGEIYFLEEWPAPPEGGCDPQVLSILRQLCRQASGSRALHRNLKGIQEAYQAYGKRPEATPGGGQPAEDTAPLWSKGLHTACEWHFPYRQAWHQRLWQQYSRKLPEALRSRWQDCYAELQESIPDGHCILYKNYRLLHF
ncbi:MAG: replication-associated recombination protein A [Spirochaetota bacterium]